jgi:hypothetical protein
MTLTRPLILALALALVFTGCAWVPSLRERPSKSKETDNTERMALIPAAQLDAARAAIPRAENLREAAAAEAPEGSVWLVTYATQVEWLRAAGIDVQEVSNNVPRRYLDPTYESRLANGPARHADGTLATDDGYKDSAMVERLIRAFAEEYPEITRLHEIGRTWEDRPIMALVISDNPEREEGEPAVLFIGQHHGSELLSSEPVFDTIEYLTENYPQDPQVQAWIETYEIWCVPTANPDGLDRHWHFSVGTGRNNGRDADGDGEKPVGDGVDLNRNYPFRWAEGGDNASGGEPLKRWYRGPSPGSEPEVQAVMALADAQRFVSMISYHTAATRLLVPYTIDNVANPEPSAAWIMAYEFEPLVESHREGRPYVAARNLYSVDGTDQDWHHFEHGTEAYLVELPRHNPEYDVHRGPIVEGIRPMWMYLLDRLPRGPSLSGRVLDAQTREPLEATVMIDEIRWFNGERHTSHPETGRFDKLLPEGGVYNLRVECDGHLPQIIELEIGDREWRTNDVLLERSPVRP